jgi:thiol-disulfide isomerase/thioredoxin
MKLSWIVVLGTAALLPAQNPSAKGKAPAKAEPAASKPAASTYATLAELRKDSQEKRLAALEAYVSTHAKASDAADALFEAANLSKELGHHDATLRFTERYLAEHKDADGASQMKTVRAQALSASNDFAGAEKLMRELIDGSGDDLNAMVSATTALADMMVDAGKKDQAIELLKKAADSKPEVRGLKEHFLGIAANIEKIGTEPIAIGKDDLAGKPIDLASYKGKVVLVDFWATWCGPCMAELPNVIAAYQKYHDKGFEIVGISLDNEGDRAKLDKCLADKKMTWRQYFDGKGWKNEVAQAYGVNSIPATYLIGKDGKIAAVNLRGEALGERLAKMLDAPAKK